MAQEQKHVKIKPTNQAEEERAKKSEIDPVSLHRSYGVKKRETWVTRFNSILAVVLAVILIVLISVIWMLGIIFLVGMLGTIGIMLLCIVALLIVYFLPLRRLRKRIRFLSKLKRRCKTMGFKLNFQRGFFRAMRLNKEGLDFTVDTGKKLWCVRFFTPKRYLSHVTFINKDTVEIKTNITQSRFKFVLGLNSVKLKRIEYSFDDKVERPDRRVAYALILNPVPHDMFKKDPDGAVIPIGTGEYLYGYTVFSGSGFLDTLRREE